jgi:D-glycero-D-manno-heptose 1,7-bisphosphate phosphatase
MHAKLTQLVLEQGGEIAAIFYCPHAPEDNCKCRKPLPGMLDAIEAEFNTSVEGCYFVGDSLRDLQAGLHKGCKPILVKTGNGEKTLIELASVNNQLDKPQVTFELISVFENLAAATDFVIATANGN